MPATKDEVIAGAMALSEADRLDVIERLSVSVSSLASVSAAWDAEIDRRLDAVESGRAKFIPWEEARRQIRGGGDAARD